jgi:hypothetical protein
VAGKQELAPSQSEIIGCFASKSRQKQSSEKADNSFKNQNDADVSSDATQDFARVNFSEKVYMKKSI